MTVVQGLGTISDAVTRRLVHSLGKYDRTDLFEERMGVVRSAQLEAIISTSRPMMLANLANALALICVGVFVGHLAVSTVIWALVIAAYALSGWRRATLYERSERRPTAGTRAPGKITLSSFVLAVLWCYPVVFILPTGTTIEIAFVAALTSGMVAGGILALYPVPMAAIVYSVTLWIASFAVIFFTDVLPALPFAIVTAAFSYVALHSILRHAGMFLSELVEKLQAQRQSDITNLLMHAYQGAGGHYLWRCSQAMRLATDPAPLRRMLNLPESVSRQAHLLDLLQEAGAEVLASDGSRKPVDHIHGLLTARQHFEVTLTLRDDRTLEFVGRPEAKSGEYSTGFHGYLKDVTQETRSADEIRRLASRDALTGLLNYREFRARGDVLIAEARDGDDSDTGESHAGHSFAFFFFDADNLKTVNDNFGHGAGDQLIIEIATRLAAQFPPGSLIARKGGDEFVALIRCDDPERLAGWSEALLHEICGDFSRNGLHHTVSCCIGVAHQSGEAGDLSELELKADRALYQAKSNGKRQVRLYDDDIGQKLHRTRVLETDFKYALAEPSLYLDFQPIFDTATLKAVGTEALLRWTHPIFGAVPPEEIVSLAKSESLNIKLLELVVAKAIEEDAKLPYRGFLSVNINPADLSASDIGERIIEMLGDVDFPPERLWLEITESEVLTNSPEARSNLSVLREAGVRIAIDDFGAGYSSLGRLETMPADILKIDKELVRNCNVNPGQKVILNSLKPLSQIHGLTLVAEGVETDEEIATLKECEVGMLQGFGLARPMSPARITEIFRADKGLSRAGSDLKVAV